MNKLIYGLIAVAVMTSCSKSTDGSGYNSDQEVQVIEHQTTTDSNALEVSEGFVMFDELSLEDIVEAIEKIDNKTAMGIGRLRDTYVIIHDTVDNLGPFGTADKEFKNNKWGQIQAGNYAAGIMENGGCVKGWIGDNGMINVIEVDC